MAEAVAAIRRCRFAELRVKMKQCSDTCCATCAFRDCDLRLAAILRMLVHLFSLGLKQTAHSGREPALAFGEAFHLCPVPLHSSPMGSQPCSRCRSFMAYLPQHYTPARNISLVTTSIMVLEVYDWRRSTRRLAVLSPPIDSRLQTVRENHDSMTSRSLMVRYML